MKKTSVSTLGVFIWFIAATFYLYEFFLRTFVGSLAHEIMPALKLNAETFSILGSSYYLAYGIMQVPVGVLADKFGVKKTMLFATLMCTLATFFFAQTTHFMPAVAARFLMGFGSSFAFVCLLVVAITWFPRKYFGSFSGASQFIGTMGPFLAGGPLVAFMARYHESWRTALNSVAIFGFVLFLLVLFFVKAKPKGSDKTLIFLSPDIPFKTRLVKLFRNKQAWFVAIYSGSCYASIALLAAVWGTAYLQSKGLSQLMAADMISIAWLGFALTCPLMGMLSDFFKRRKPFLVFNGITGLVSTVFIVFSSVLPVWLYAILFFCVGVAAAGQSLAFAAISEHVDVDTRATALGLNNAAITLLGAVIPPIVSYFIDLSAGSASAHLKSSDFTIGLSIMPVLYLISVIVSVFFIRETYCKPQKEFVVLSVD